MSEKSKKPTIDRAEAISVFEQVDAANPGKLTREDKSGWIKVTSAASKNRVYIQNREDVREIHLSGWGKDLPGTVEPPKANGKVQAHVDMEGDALATLKSVLEALAEQVATEPSKKEKAEAAPKAPKEKKKPPSDADRVERIKKRAAELGLNKKLEVDEDGQAADPAAFEEAVEEAVASENA